MKAFLTIITVCLVSCVGKQGEQAKPVFDEASLKAFVLSSHTINESETLKKLDSIISIASNDSIIFRQTISFLETPFSNPNSSYCNQNLYSKLLAAEIQSHYFIPYEKEVAQGKLKLLQQNNVGNPANDFTYIAPSGDKKKMYDIKANYLLLYFNNPDCNACREMKEALVASNTINQKTKSGALKILSIYPDKDEKLWLDHLIEYPAQWIQGRDEEEHLYKNKVYDLKAIPTIYLLDSNKKVVLKDCLEVGAIEKAIDR